jgi:geranylgeranyl diphosphate synthase type II
MSTSTVDQLPLDAFMNLCRERVQRVLKTQLETLPGPATRLRDAMLHASLLGGKRVRPVLAYASAQAVGGTLEAADMAACATELVHCYSLVHDDLPAMDDDDLRRGKPTVHIAFDEATAILAGDALQALAFRLLSDPTLHPAAPVTSLRMINLLAAAAGFEGMVSGQSIDFEATGRSVSLQDLQTMHSLKTGALISASVLLGALTTEKATDMQLSALGRYAECIGLAFQVQDDILDVVSDTATLGKTQGADQAMNKPTYVSLLGLDAARSKAQDLCDSALAALTGFDGRADALRQIARYIVERRH